MAELGLSDHHDAQVVNYMRFARYQRGQKLRAVTACFDDVKHTRLQDDTYTRDEVEELLDELCSLVKGEVESEFINSSHTTALLLRQLCSQADHWHLKLQADTSELENRDLLEKIRSFEEEEFSGRRKGKAPLSPTKHRLQPLGDIGSTALLSAEIERLRAENTSLRERIKMIESQATNALHDKTDLNKKLSSTKEELMKLKETVETNSEVADKDLFNIQDEMALVKQELESSLQASTISQQKLEQDLTSTKHRLLEVQAQLDLAEKELEKKFQKTGAYANMKKMLVQKNDTIKELRTKLCRLSEDEGTPHVNESSDEDK